MNSSTLVDGSASGPPAIGAPETGPVQVPGTAPERLTARTWLRRHLGSICWFAPLLLASVAVEAVVLQAREGVNEPSVFTGAPSAVFFASVSAALLWVLARRLRFSRPVAAAALLLFLFSPIALVTHTTPALQNAAVPLLLAGAIVALSGQVPMRFRMIALSVVGVVLVLVVVFPLVWTASTSPEPALSRWWNLDPALLILGAGCSLIALALKRLRPFGAVSLVLMLLALRPGVDLPASTVVVWLPLAVLLVAGVVQEAVQNAFDADFSSLWQEIASGVFLVTTVGVFIFAASALAPGYRSLLPSTEPPTSTGPIDVPAAGAAAGVDPGAPVAEAPAAAAATPAPVLTAAPSPSVDPAAAAQSASAGQSAARASAGAELSENPALALTIGAAAELRAGDVDVRSILALGQLLTSTDIAVADFPAIDSDDGQPRRQILIDSVDGASAQGDERLKNEVASYFMSLSAPLAGANVVGTDEGVLVIFPFGEPVELLPSTGGG